MNLAVVLDRSGSMADQSKIEYAKKAVRTLIEQLQNDDVFSFVIYDDIVDVVREAKPVHDKRELLYILDEVFPRGATNLGGGLAEGLRQVERHRDKEYLNRVILLSDGLANRGVTDPHELQRMVQRYRGRSVSVTTMGVGLEYNENLMVRLSDWPRKLLFHREPAEPCVHLPEGADTPLLRCGSERFNRAAAGRRSAPSRCHWLRTSWRRRKGGDSDRRCLFKRAT